MIELEYYNFQIKKLEEYYLFRYFNSLTKLESFLRDGIYLCRADKFSDNLECITKKEMILVNGSKYYNELKLEHNPHLTKEELNDIKDKFQQNLRNVAKTLKLNQQKYFISCWYISDSKLEDELMWRTYGKGSEDKNSANGFMIKINLKDFIQNFNLLSSNLNTFDKLILGQVRYYDFSNDENIKEVKYAGFRKHASFSSEKEFRILFKNKGKDEATIFVKPPASLYEDTIIYSHPIWKTKIF